MICHQIWIRDDVAGFSNTVLFEFTTFGYVWRRSLSWICSAPGNECRCQCRNTLIASSSIKRVYFLVPMRSTEMLVERKNICSAPSPFF